MSGMKRVSGHPSLIQLEFNDAKNEGQSLRAIVPATMIASMAETSPNGLWVTVSLHNGQVFTVRESLAGALETLQDTLPVSSARA